MGINLNGLEESEAGFQDEAPIKQDKPAAQPKPALQKSQTTQPQISGQGKKIAINMTNFADDGQAFLD